HRGVAMGSAVLIAQGYDPHEAMKLITQRRMVADPHIFYIRNRILRFARERSEWDGDKSFRDTEFTENTDSV
ncbi:MAG TPA: hypothetical protein VI753_04710, partial [Anaerolineales bacterium]|nr:hypothetical protein [Anaerolineales bacterium]